MREGLNRRDQGWRGGMKTQPLLHHPGLSSQRQQKSHNVIKMEVVFGLSTAPRLSAVLEYCALF